MLKFNHIVLSALFISLSNFYTYATELDTFKIQANGPLEFCEGDKVILSAPLECDSYVWSNGETTQSIEVRKSGDYFVTVFNHKGNGQSITSEPVKVTVYPALQVSIISSCSPIICLGDSLILYAISDKSYKYQWSNGEEGNLLVVKKSGKYSVTVTDKNGCKGFAEFEVKSFQKNSSYITSSNNKNSISEGETIKLTVYPNGLKYKWNTGDTTQSISISNYGRYCVVTYIDCDKPCKDTVCINISKKDFPDIKITPSKDPTKNNGRDSIINNGRDTIIKNPNDPSKSDTIKFNSPTSKVITICLGDSIFLIATSGFDKYLWNTGETTRIIKVKKIGIYTVVGTNNNGFSATDKFEVKQTDKQTLGVTQIGENNFCVGGSTRLEAASGFEKYKWNTGDTTRSIIVIASGAYQVSAFVGECELKSDSIKINVLPKPDYKITAPDGIRVCIGTQNTLSIKIQNRLNAIQKFYIKDKLSDRFNINVNEIVVLPNSESRVVSGFDATNAELNRTYNSSFTIIDECGKEEIAKVSATVYDVDFNLNLINKDTIARKPGVERTLFITTKNLNRNYNFSNNDTIFVTLKNEVSTLELKKVTSNCGTNSFSYNKKTGISEIRFIGGCGLIPDTLASLTFETAIGITLSPEVKIEKVYSNNSCFNFSTNPVIIDLLPYDCEIRTVNIKYSYPILKSVTSNNNNFFTIKFSLQAASNLDLFLSDIYGNKEYLFKNLKFNEGDFEITKNLDKVSNGLYFISIKNNFGASTLPVIISK